MKLRKALIWELPWWFMCLNLLKKTIPLNAIECFINIAYWKRLRYAIEHGATSGRICQLRTQIQALLIYCGVDIWDD